MKIVIASGNFDPLHVGHVRYLKEACKLGDMMVVIVNNDQQVKLKKGFVFMKAKEREEIIEGLNLAPFSVITSLDKDLSVNETLKEIAKRFKGDVVIFAKGGDSQGTREAETCKKLSIQIVTGVGGKKIQSSSKLMERARAWKNQSPQKK